MSRHVATVYRRADLFEQVWSAPMRNVARQYGVSDVALRKTCKKLGVPIPDTGHWNKRPDRRPPRPALPPLAAGAVDELTIDYWTSDTGPTEPLPATLAAVIANEKTAAAAIHVGTVLTDPHPLVATAQRVLGRARTSERGIKVRGEQRCLDVAVSPTQLDRALRIMDALAKGLATRPLQLAVVDRPEVPKRPYWYSARKIASLPRIATAVDIGGKRVYLRLVELVDVERPRGPEPPPHLTGFQRDTWRWKHSAPEPRYHPNGNLELVAICEEQQATWRDGKRWHLEGCLNTVVAQLHLLAHRQRETDEARRRAEVQAAEEERRRYAKRLQEEEDLRRSAGIREQIDRWTLARRIRADVARTHEVIKAGGCELIESSDLAAILRWASAYAERIDPIAQLRAEVAEHVAERAAGRPCAADACEEDGVDDEP